MMTAEQLKNSILQLAMQGKLVEQRPEEGSGEDLYNTIQAEKKRLVKEGTIKKVLKKENRVIIEGINLVKKHQKGNGQESGGILEVEAPIHASNVMIIDPKTKKPTRIGKKIDKDKKVRIAIKSSEKLD